MRNGVNDYLVAHKEEELYEIEDTKTILLENLQYGVYSLAITATISVEDEGVVIEDSVVEQYRILHIPPNNNFSEPLIATYLKESFLSDPID
jgi:hypothetical protein